MSINITTNNAMKTDTTGDFTAVSATQTGSDAILTVPANTKWRVKSIEVDVNASATVANRFIGIEAYVNSLVSLFIETEYTQTAGQHVYYGAGPGLPFDTALSSSASVKMGFPEVVLGPGDELRTACTGLQTGDVVTIVANVESFGV